MKVLYWFIGIYFLSAFVVWLWWFIAYSKNGKYPNQRMHNADKNHALRTVFFPLFNTFMAIVGWFQSPYPKISNNPNNRTFTDYLFRTNRPK